jgi:hypothetical protein
MYKNKVLKKGGNKFYLEKWFLDCTSDDGEALIFYAAKLKWGRWTVPYTAILYYGEDGNMTNKSRYSRVNIPEKNDQTILWSDSQFGVEGKWLAMASPLKARVFESEEGYLDWNCFQPASKVELNYKNKIIKGNGYVEQLIMTIPAWKIPMDELRWGRYLSPTDNMVWIELKKNTLKQWLWLNGEKIQEAVISDDQIFIPSKDISVEFDRSVVLESEKKILSVVETLVNYIPGFNKIMPLQFLMADEFKWFGNGVFKKSNKFQNSGKTIHEFVNFKKGTK